MRGYLSLQAARSIGSIDSLSPRLPSVFEPAGDDGSLEIIADAARADIRPDPSVSGRAMKAERPMTAGRRATDTNQGWAPEENADGKKVSARMSSEERVKDSVPSRANEPKGVEAVAAQNPDKALSSHQHLDIKSIERRGSPTISGEEVDREVRSHFRQIGIPAAEVHVGKRISIEGMGTMERRTTVEARPSIKVSIGRIDVRAVAEKAEKDPPRPAREHPGRPKLSLEEYLKKGRDGKV